MAEQASNVVLNFKMDGQIEYARTIKDINAIMNAAASEYKTHVAAMGRDADQTQKLAAEKKKLEIQMGAAKERTKMLRAEYEAMAQDTSKSTAELAAKYNQLQNSERAEIALSNALERVNDGLSEQAEASRANEEAMGGLQKESTLLESQMAKLKSEFELATSELGENATEAEKAALAQEYLGKKSELVERQIANMEEQLAIVTEEFGENSVEANRMETELNEARTAFNNLGNEMGDMSASSDDAQDSFGGLTDVLSSAVLMEVADRLSAISDKIIEIGKSSVEAAATAQASNAQFTQVFQEMEDQAQETVENLGEEFGILPNRLKPTYSAISSQLMSLGIDQKTAMEMAAESTTSAADAAAFYDLSLEDAASRVQSFLKGNLSAAEGIGIFASASGLATYAISNGFVEATEEQEQFAKKMELSIEKAEKNVEKALKKYGEGSLEARTATQKLNEELQKQEEGLNLKGKWDELSEAQKQAVRVDYITHMQEQAQVTGQAAREMDGYENVVGNAKSAVDDFMAAIGEEALNMFVSTMEVVIPLIKGFADWFSNLNPAVKQFITIFAGVVAVVGALLPVFAAGFAGIAAAATMAGVTIGTFVTATLLPIIGIVVGIIAAITGLIVVITNWGAITDWLKEKWGQFTAWIGKLMSQLAENLPIIFQKLKEKSIEIWEAIKESIADILKKMKELALSVWDGIKEAWASVVESLKDAWNSVKQYFVDLWGDITKPAVKVWDKVFEAWSTAIGSIKEIFAPLIEYFSNVWEPISEMATTVWENISTFLAGLWKNIQTIASSAWEIIKNVILGPILLLIDLVSGDMEAFKENLSAIWENISQAAGRIWESIKDIVISYITTLIDNAKAIFEGYVEMISGYWNAILETASNIWTTIVETIRSYLILLEDSFNTGMEFIKTIIDTVWSFIRTTWEEALQAIFEATGLNFESIRDNVSMVMDAIGQSIDTIWYYVSETFLNALAFIKELVTGDFKGMKNVIKGQMDLIKETIGFIWSDIKDVFFNTIAIVKSFVTQGFESLKNSAKQKMQDMWTSIKNTWENIKSTFSNMIENIKTTVSTKFTDLKNSASDKMNETKAKIEEIWENVMSFFRNIDLMQIGKDVIDGLIKGITSKVEAVGNAVKEVTSAITGKIKSILNIQSPSRVLMELGRFITEGLGIGISSMKDFAVDKTTQVANAVSGAMNNALEFVAPDVEIGRVVTQPSQFGASGGNNGSMSAASLLNNIGSSISDSLKGLSNNLQVLVYLDTDELNTKMAPGMSKQLNDRNKMNARSQGVVMI